MNILLVSSFESFLQLVGLLIIFAVVLMATWLTTRWMGGYQKAHATNKNLKIIETIPMGNNKMISIVKAGQVYLVVSVGKDEIHLLSELTREELADFSFENESSTTPIPESFQELLDKVKGKVSKK